MKRSHRRLRYACFRVMYVAWRALYVNATLWHAAIALAGALVASIVLVKWGPDWGLPYAAYFTPLGVAGAYGIVLILVRFRRAWRSFPEMRRQMRAARMAELRYVGYARKRFARETFLRVSVPFYGLLVAGGVFVAWMFPGRRSIGEVVCIIVLSVAGMVLWVLLERWNERFRPRDAERRCPRCGYDVSASPQRCPECGLRRRLPARDGEGGAEGIRRDLIDP